MGTSPLLCSRVRPSLRPLWQLPPPASSSPPAAAFASSCDSPKQSYFGASPMSAPFGETYTARGNDSLFVKMDQTEREIFARIAKQSKEQLTNIMDYIAKKDWDRSRTALRLYMYETRKSMTRFNDKTGDTEAAKLYAKFKKQIEATDFALTKKDGDKADAALQGAISTFTSWLEVVGIPT